MSAVQAFSNLIANPSQPYSRGETLIIEAALFLRVYEELKELFRRQYSDYFQLLKYDNEKESAMIEANFIRCVIQDILATREYTMEGIACYTATPEDVIYELAAGCNTNPTLSVSRRIIDLHRSVRPTLYKEIINKITQGEEKCRVD